MSNIVSRELLQNINKISDVLKTNNITDTIQQIIQGPIVSAYCFEPFSGVSMNDIYSLETNISKLFNNYPIYINHISETNLVAINIPNVYRDMIFFDELKKSVNPNNYTLPIIMGTEQNGKVLTYDLCKMPHLLILGTRGVGKSTFLYSVIESLSSKRNYKLFIIDNKNDDFNIINRQPLLSRPVINTPSKAAECFNYLIQEMITRIQILKDNNVCSITEYNNISENLMNYCVVIINGLSELTNTNLSTEIKANIANLITQGTSVGIHIIATDEEITDCDFAYFQSRLVLHTKKNNYDKVGTLTPKKLLTTGHGIFNDSKSAPLAIHTPYININDMKTQINTCYVFNKLFENTLSINELKTVIKDGILPNFFPNNSILSLFHLACFKNNTKIVELLIKAGADVNLQNEYGETPLYYANADISRVLLKYGADPTITSYDGSTVIMGNMHEPEKLQLMIDNGIDINATCHSLGQTVLHKTKNIECVKILLKNGADINAIDDLNETPLECHLDNPEIIKLLLDNGAKITKESTLYKLLSDKELINKVQNKVSS